MSKNNSQLSIFNYQLNKKLPSRDEIKEVLDFTKELFDKVCDILSIDKNEMMK